MPKPRPRAAVHRPRARVGARLPDGGLPQGRREVERGRGEVLHHRCAVHGGDAVRHEPDLRRHRRRREARRHRAALSEVPPELETLAFAAILFVVVGFAFKVSAVPFQFWAPDTYEGAPVPVAAFLAVASSAAGFAGLLQLMFVAFIWPARVLGPDLRAALGGHDDGREPGGAPAGADRAAAGLLGHRTVGVHPVDVRARDRRRGGEPIRRSRPRSPTS